MPSKMVGKLRELMKQDWDTKWDYLRRWLRAWSGSSASMLLLTTVFSLLFRLETWHLIFNRIVLLETVLVTLGFFLIIVVSEMELPVEIISLGILVANFAVNLLIPVFPQLNIFLSDSWLDGQGVVTAMLSLALVVSAGLFTAVTVIAEGDGDEQPGQAWQESPPVHMTS